MQNSIINYPFSILNYQFIIPMSNIIKSSDAKLVLQYFDLENRDSLPDLSTTKPLHTELTSTYWSPQDEGDTLRAFYNGIESSTYIDQKTGESIDLPCVLLIAQDPKTKNLVNMRNGSKRLVATLESHEEKGTISRGTPLEITYMGKKRNKRNENFSDHWSIKPLVAAS